MANDVPYRQEDTLREMYCENGLSVTEIADEFEVSVSTIWNWLRKNDIEISKWPSAEERFNDAYDVIDESGCWEWQRGVTGSGYGQITVNGDSMGAHRFSYELYNGDIPEDAIICHKCHNPPCVNPNHLYAGDEKRNAQDAIENGDWPDHTGEERTPAKFTSGKVRTIREEYTKGATVSALSKKYSVSMGTISRIINGESYPDAGGPTNVDTHGRMARRGEENNKTKLSPDDVREIRRIYDEEDVTMAELGGQFDISSTQVSDIVNRNVWQHVE